MSMRDIIRNWEKAIKNGEDYIDTAKVNTDKSEANGSEIPKDTVQEDTDPYSQLDGIFSSEGPAARLQSIQEDAKEKGALSLNNIDFTYVVPKDRESMRDGSMSKADCVNLGMSYAYDLQTFADTECTVAANVDAYGGFDIKKDELGKDTDVYTDLVREMYESDVKSEYGFPMSAYETVNYAKELPTLAQGGSEENDEFIDNLGISCPDGTDRVKSRMDAKQYLDGISTEKNTVEKAMSFADEHFTNGKMERKNLESAGKSAMDALVSDMDLLSETSQSDVSKEAYQVQWSEKASMLTDKFYHVSETHGVSNDVMQSFVKMSNVANLLNGTENNSASAANQLENESGTDEANDYGKMALEKFGNVLQQVSSQLEDGLEK